MLATFTALALGLVQGLRHAFEPDHLAAVTTLVADKRGSGAAMWMGAAWGLGHTLMLLAVGGAMLCLRAEMPARAEDVFELVVAVMLVGLGVRAVTRAYREARGGSKKAHAHGNEAHEHSGPHAHVHVFTWRLATRPLAIGLVHGLAGSGALTAIVLPGMPSVGEGLVFMALFGVGSTVGMTLLTKIAGWPLAHIAQHPRFQSALLGSAGLLSLVVGVMWGAASALKIAG